VEPTRNRRSDMLLRVFFLGELPPVEAAGYLRRRAEAATAGHDRLTALAAVLDGPDRDELTGYGRLALEWGLRFSAMRREWAEWAGDRLAPLNDAR
jgi:PadR family transcriptional regulator AphA